MPRPDFFGTAFAVGPGVLRQLRTWQQKPLPVASWQSVLARLNKVGTNARFEPRTTIRLERRMVSSILVDGRPDVIFWSTGDPIDL